LIHQIENILENKIVKIKLLRYIDVNLASINKRIFNDLELQEFNSFKSEKRKHEYYSTRILWQSFEQNEPIKYKSTGKPIINGGYISISHSHNQVAIAFSSKTEIGLDLEMISSKVDVIKSKYLHVNEKYASLKDLTIIWTIKEAIYKLFDSETLFFKEHIEVCSLSEKCMVNVDFKGEIQRPFIETITIEDKFILSYAY